MESLILPNNNESIPDTLYTEEVWSLNKIIQSDKFFTRDLTPQPQRVEVMATVMTNKLNNDYIYTTSNQKKLIPTLYNIELLEIPKCMLHYHLTDTIEIPALRIMYEINTKNLAFKKIKLKKLVQGLYSNESKSDEWIIDCVPTNSYTIIGLSFTANNYEITQDTALIKEKCNIFMYLIRLFREELLLLKEQDPQLLYNGILIDKIYRKYF